MDAKTKKAMRKGLNQYVATVKQFAENHGISYQEAQRAIRAGRKAKPGEKWTTTRKGKPARLVTVKQARAAKKAVTILDPDKDALAAFLAYLRDRRSDLEEQQDEIEQRIDQISGLIEEIEDTEL